MSTQSTAASPAVIDKAARLYHEGRVNDHGPAHQYEVRGDSWTYRVTLGGSEDLHVCSCPAYGTCSHIAAAMLAHGNLTPRLDPRDPFSVQREAARRRGHGSGVAAVVEKLPAEPGTLRTSAYSVAVEEAMKQIDVLPDYDCGNGPEPCVHTFAQSAVGPLGAHWSLESVRAFFEEHGVEKAGPAAVATGHGLVVPRSDRPGPIFFATDGQG